MTVVDMNSNNMDVQGYLQKMDNHQKSSLATIQKWQKILLITLLNLAPVMGYTMYMVMNIPTTQLEYSPAGAVKV